MNKLTKLLSVFILAGAVGAGVAGVAGCNKGGNDSGHQHDYEYTQIAGNAEKHTVHCKNDGHEGGDTQENHDWVGDKCSKCDYPKPTAGSELVIEANVTGLIIEGVTSETITLSASKKSHTIDKSAIKVYFATGNNADVKGSEVPAANLVLELKDGDGAAVSSWENIRKDGEYKVNASIQNATMASGAVATLNDLKSTVTVTISNPVITNSLAVKSGTLTQGASVQNKMSADWTYTVTLANGDLEDYTGAVTVSVDTSSEGTKTATLTSGNLTGTVEVVITASTLRTETYASNLSGMDIATISPDAETPNPVGLFQSANGKTKLEVCGLKVEANGNNAAKECDGKYFVNRAPFTGATFTAAGALQKNQRYFTLTTEGAAKLTIYWSRNSSKDERGVSVFNSTVAGGDISTLVPGAETIGKATVMGDGTTATQGVQKLEVNIPAAGTYWITSANNQNVYFYYIELATEFEGAGNNVVLEDGEKTLTQIKVSHTDSEHKDEFVVGDTFNVDAGYSVTGTYVTANTAKKSEEALTAGVTYWLGDNQLVPGTTKLDAELFTALGNNVVTVKYGEETVTGSYTIFVDSAVPGITGVTATVKSTVVKEVEADDGKVELAKSDIELAKVGVNDDATISAYTVKYRLASAEAGTETEITADAAAQLGIGDYKLVITATVSVGTVDVKSAEFTVEIDFKVSKKLAEGELAKVVVSLKDMEDVDTDTSTEQAITGGLSLAGNTVTSAKIGSGGTWQINTKSTTVDVDGVTYSRAFNTKGGSTNSSGIYRRYIELTLKQPGNYKVTVYALSGSATDSTRKVVVSGEASGANPVEATTACGTTEVTAHEFTVNNTSSIRVGGGAAILIYAIVVEPIA